MSKRSHRATFVGGVTCSPLITRVLDNLNKIRGRKAPAFTLTEVLLAVLIVGVIAALVLPAVVTKYQDKTFESAFNREVHSLQDSIDSLAAVENQQSFYETTLAKTPETYMKKYLRVSKYCGASGKDCFGKFYSEYSGHEKKTYTPSYDGNCAI
ncbi:MAG: type II secretion system protein, partial [Cyanobacteriota bacterium]|nr:type II secretion system protein [Cyanobacteriota bacterium]